MSSLAENASAVARAQSKPRRAKLFGDGKCVPLDRNGKARVMAYARALSHRTEPGRHYNELTDKFLSVLRVLLWQFHNAASGKCYPSYETIAEHAHCGRTTVYSAIVALERVGLLTWCHRLARIRAWDVDLFGKAQNRVRVIRTSNGYVLIDPQPPARPVGSSEFNFQTGTTDQESKKENKVSSDALGGALGAAIGRLGDAVRANSG